MRKKRGIYWNKEEEKLLKKLYPLYLQDLLTREDLLKVFERRTWRAISHKASELKLQVGIPRINKEYLKNLLKRRGIKI